VMLAEIARQALVAASAPYSVTSPWSSSHQPLAKPPLRPLGPPPQMSCSRTTTPRSGSRSVRKNAVHRPVKPPPTITTSALTSPDRAGQGRPGSWARASRSHQLRWAPGVRAAPVRFREDCMALSIEEDVTLAENSGHELEHRRSAGHPRPHRLHPCRHRVELPQDRPDRHRPGALVPLDSDREDLASQPRHADPAPGVPGLRGRGGRLALPQDQPDRGRAGAQVEDRKSTRLNSSHSQISYAVFCLKKKKKKK